MERLYKINNISEEYDLDDLLDELYSYDDIWDNEVDTLEEMFDDENDGANICGQYYSASDIYKAIAGEDSYWEQLSNIASDLYTSRKADAEDLLERASVGQDVVLWETKNGRVTVSIVEKQEEEEVEVDDEAFSDLLVA